MLHVRMKYMYIIICYINSAVTAIINIKCSKKKKVDQSMFRLIPRLYRSLGMRPVQFASWCSTSQCICPDHLSPVCDHLQQHQC